MCKRAATLVAFAGGLDGEKWMLYMAPHLPQVRRPVLRFNSMSLLKSTSTASCNGTTQARQHGIERLTPEGCCGGKPSMTKPFLASG